jgi:hypothetical protein
MLVFVNVNKRTHLYRFPQKHLQMHKVSECSGQAATDVSLFICDSMGCTNSDWCVTPHMWQHVLHQQWLMCHSSHVTARVAPTVTDVSLFTCDSTYCTNSDWCVTLHMWQHVLHQQRLMCHSSRVTACVAPTATDVSLFTWQHVLHQQWLICHSSHVTACVAPTVTDMSLFTCDSLCCTKLKLEFHIMCHAEPIWYICTCQPHISLDCTCRQNRQQHNWVHSIRCILTSFWHKYCTNFFICTECCGTLGNASASYLGDLKFKYWPWGHINWNVLIATFNSCRQIKE